MCGNMREFVCAREFSGRGMGFESLQGHETIEGLAACSTGGRVAASGGVSRPTSGSLARPSSVSSRWLAPRPPGVPAAPVPTHCAPVDDVARVTRNVAAVPVGRRVPPGARMQLGVSAGCVARSAYRNHSGAKSRLRSCGWRLEPRANKRDRYSRLAQLDCG